MAGAGHEPAGFEVAVHRSLDEVGRTDWDALFPGDVEGHDLYRTLEAVAQPGFSHGCVTVRSQGQLIAAAPMFEMIYRLDTPFRGALKAFADRIHGLAPRLTSVAVLGLGSPMSDNCSIGFAPWLDERGRVAVLAALLDGLGAEARKRRSTVVALKSVGPLGSELDATARAAGYNRVTSVPVAMLPLSYPTMGAYLASLPEKTSSYLQRKMRAEKAMRIEYRDVTTGLDERLLSLYRATLAQSAARYGDIDEVHPEYFAALLAGLGERARLMLCWKGDELLSFQLFLVGDKRIIANKIGMQYPAAREYNLYFINWMKMIEFAIERGIPEIEMGATAYQAKLLFGGHLERRWLYFRFRNGLLNRLSQPTHGFFDFERNDPELKALAARIR